MAVHAIHHLDCGTMCPLAASLMGSKGHFWNRGLLVCHCLLLETDHGLVLIDSGMGTRDLCEDSRLPATYRFLTKPPFDGPTALSHVLKLGYNAADVQHIFVTHLDLDHAGGLSDFPNATVHIYQRELDAARSPGKGQSDRYVAEQWSDARWQCYPDASGETWFGFEKVTPIAPLADSIAIVPLHGHSPGHCGIAVDTGAGWLLHAGDAFFHRNDLEKVKVPFGIKMLQRSVDSDPSQRVSNLKRLQSLHATQSEVQIFCSHDPEQFISFLDYG